MLFSALKHQEISKEVYELYEIKWDEPPIEINKKQDLLTPFLIIEYLSLLKKIVKKGLKKSYYKTEGNLNNRVKGKILVSKTIKSNLMKGKQLNTVCSFEEFGINNIENRLLNKALVFIQRLLPRYTSISNEVDVANTFKIYNLVK